MTRPVYTSPIIFSAPMIRALLDGRKTQTRRLITSQWANIKMHHELGERCFLWSRETWLNFDGQDYYRADTTPDGDAIRKAYGAGWKPSIHMPRRVSRLTLEMTNARVQRLQDISEEDAKAEGVEHNGPCDHKRQQCGDIGCFGPDSFRGGYFELWDSLHGSGSWNSNPQIMALGFRVHQQNVDALIAERGHHDQKAL